MRVLELPEGDTHQLWIDLADQDLLAAIYLFRACRKSDNLVFARQICYLLHQATEKWIKLCIEKSGSVKKLKSQNAHNLGFFLEEALLGSEFACIQDWLKVIDERTIEQSFSSNIRYTNEFEGKFLTWAILLLPIVFECRRIAKRFVKQKLLDGDDNE